MNEKAQGALEYLIIVAAVLGIVAVVVGFVSGVFGGQRGEASLAACKAAASRCAVRHETTVSPSCEFCETACLGVGDEAQNIAYCMEGEVELISD